MATANSVRHRTASRGFSAIGRHGSTMGLICQLPKWSNIPRRIGAICLYLLYYASASISMLFAIMSITFFVVSYMLYRSGFTDTASRNYLNEHLTGSLDTFLLSYIFGMIAYLVSKIIKRNVPPCKNFVKWVGYFICVVLIIRCLYLLWIRDPLIVTLGSSGLVLLLTYGIQSRLETRSPKMDQL